MYVVVTFVGAKLDESTTSSVDEAVCREWHIISEFRRLCGSVKDLDPESAKMADKLNTELTRLGLDIEIIELRERDSVWFLVCHYIHEVNGVNWRIYCSTCVSVHPSVRTHI